MSEGILTLPAEEYHAGPDDTPRLSASIASILWAKTPLHAWTAHPRLNPAYEREDDGKFDLGTVAHAALLQGDGHSVYVVHEDSWRTKTSKESRDYARELGKVPLLAKDRDRVHEMCESLRAKLPALFVDGKPEVSLAWSRDDVDFKARIDWLANDCTRIIDLKTSSQVARFDRTLFDHGYDIQAAMYRRAVDCCFDVRADYTWVVVETTPPFEFRLIRPGADVLTVAERKLDWAIGKWRECMANGEWPGYSREIVEAELPAWEEAKLLAKEAA